MSDKSTSSGQPLPREFDDKISEDRREQFEKLSSGVVVDPDAERAFLTSKIDLIRADPGLNEDAKNRAIAELQQRVRELQRLTKGS